MMDEVLKIGVPIIVELVVISAFIGIGIMMVFAGLDIIECLVITAAFAGLMLFAGIEIGVI